MNDDDKLILPSTKKVLDDFKFLYEEYYLEDDENLGKYGKKIKDIISEILEEE